MAPQIRQNLNGITIAQVFCPQADNSKEIPDINQQ
jgi:hypothetical protein